MKIRGFATALGSAVVAAAALTAASDVGSAADGPAPRKLPRGDRMFTIPCNAPSDVYHLHSVDPVTAEFTSIGGTIDVQDSICAYGMAYDRKRKRSYFLAGNTSTFRWPLMRVDLRTGATTFVGDLEENDAALNTRPAVVAVSGAGRGYAIVGNVLYALDLTTAAVTRIGDTGVSDDVYAFAFRPRTRRAYAVSETGGVHRIDLGTGNATHLGDLSLAGSYVYSLQIDTRGTLWVNDGGGAVSGQLHLGSFRLSDIAGSLIPSSGAMTHYSGAFLITHGRTSPRRAPRTRRADR